MESSRNAHFFGDEEEKHVQNRVELARAIAGEGEERPPGAAAAAPCACLVRGGACWLAGSSILRG